MKPYVTIDKRSKKARKEYYSKLRGTWGELNPVTRSVPSGKTIIERRISGKTGESAENSVMDLMSIFAFKPIPARILADSLIRFGVL